MSDVRVNRNLRFKPWILPDDAFGVVVHADRQAFAAAQAAALENFAPTGSGHARTKTVHTHPAMNFGLISPFRHTSISLS